MIKKSSQNQSEKVATASWLSSNVHKGEVLLYSLLLLFLPTQLGKHFWFPSSQVLGIKIDYLSPTLYVTDCIILFLFLTSLFSGSLKALFISISTRAKLVLLVALLFLLLSSLQARHPEIALYLFVKVLECVFVGFYTAFVARKILSMRNIGVLVGIGVSVEAGLALSQYALQRSVGSVLYFLGERTFTPQTPGIATTSLGGELWLRAYGTFSHPNVLAGYLLLSLLLLLPLAIKSKDRLKNLWIFFVSLGTLGMVVTLSRTALLLWFGSILILLRKEGKLKKIFWYVGVIFFSLLLVFFFTPLPFQFFRSDLLESFSLRVELMHAAFRMIIDSPLFGVGPLHFVSSLPFYSVPLRHVFYIQPVHNIFLLAASEVGLLGLFFLLWFFSRTAFHLHRLRKERTVFFLLFASILILGMVDHYLFTLQQGQLLLAFSLGLLWAKETT